MVKITLNEAARREEDAARRQRREAGRYTLDEAAVELAKKSKLPQERWLEAILSAVKIGKLRFMNPENLNDTLPYKPEAVSHKSVIRRNMGFGVMRSYMAIYRTSYEQISADDVNAWLAANPQFGAWSIGATDTTKVPAQVGTIKPTVSEDWIAETVKIADRIGNERWDIGQRQITARNICDAVATELSQEANRRFWGKQGPRSADNIRNIALKGWKFVPKHLHSSGSNGSNGLEENH